MGIVLTVLWIAVLVVVIVGAWKVYEKAGKPGWAAIVPIYNIVVLLEIVGKPVWWIVLFFIPIANLIATILVSIALAEQFGQSAGFGIGLWLLPFIFMPILGFGSAQYRGAPPAPAGGSYGGPQAPPPPPPQA
jgi:Na+/glutamate symporter